MNSILIKNARVLTFNDANDIFENGSVYMEGSTIRAVGKLHEHGLKPQREIDAGGRIVMPGLINAHHHLYSSFARGFAAPGTPAVNFREILEHMWWKLDRALEEEDVYYSAMTALIECIRSGCTTVIDHHASPGCRDGSLDIIEKAFREAGLNGCLCYEVSDRNEPGAGIRENERFIKKCKQSGDRQMAALFGLHASMTLGRETLEQCAEIGKANGAGFHVHAAEDKIDEDVTLREFGTTVMARFSAAGIAGPQSIFVHGVHLNEAEMDILKNTNSILVHNPESNMNNAVGTTKVLDLLGKGILVGLGTDGMASHMMSSARAAYLLQRNFRHDPRVGFMEAYRMLTANNREITERIFKEKRGVLAEGALADVIIVAYSPTTPLTPSTQAGHLLFGLNYAPVHTTICRGVPLMENGTLTRVDEWTVCHKASERAEKMWKRFK